MYNNNVNNYATTQFMILIVVVLELEHINIKNVIH